MASEPRDSPNATGDLNHIAEIAGSAIKERLQKDMDPAQQHKAHVSFELGHYADILGGMMEKFTEVVRVDLSREETRSCELQEFPSRHPNSQLLWGKGVIILRRTTFEEGALGHVAEGRWMLALETSGEKTPGCSYSLSEKLHLETGDIYLRYSVKKVS